MATLTNRSRYVVAVENHPELTREFPYDKRREAKAYLRELRGHHKNAALTQREDKLERQQEFVIGGYRPAGDNSVDALLVGYFDAQELRFAAKVRAGLVPHVRRELARKLKELRLDDCPFIDLPSEGSSRWGGGVSAADMKWSGLNRAWSCRFNSSNGLPRAD